VCLSLSFSASVSLVLPPLLKVFFFFRICNLSSDPWQRIGFSRVSVQRSNAIRFRSPCHGGGCT
jgi:hypothetical protein